MKSVVLQVLATCKTLQKKKKKKNCESQELGPRVLPASCSCGALPLSLGRASQPTLCPPQLFWICWQRALGRPPGSVETRPLFFLPLRVQADAGLQTSLPLSSPHRCPRVGGEWREKD